MVKIVKNLVASSQQKIKCPYSMTPQYVVIHNTANDASAANEIAYMRRNSNQVSFHYAVDDKEIVQGIEETRNAWHAGDGGNGTGNRKGIAIEICYSKSGGARFDAAEKNAAELAASILKKYGWGIDRLKKHQDFNGKSCPHRTLALGWDRFVKMVEGYLNPVKSLETTGFKYGDNSVGVLALKEMLLLAKKLGIQTKGMYEDTGFGTGTKNAVNYLLKAWGYAENGIAGEAFVKKLAAEINKKV